MLSEAEIAALAKAISEETWRRMRKYIARQQRELHDLLDEEE